MLHTNQAIRDGQVAMNGTLTGQVTSEEVTVNLEGQVPPRSLAYRVGRSTGRSIRHIGVFLAGFLTAMTQAPRDWFSGFCDGLS